MRMTIRLAGFGFAATLLAGVLGIPAASAAPAVSAGCAVVSNCGSEQLAGGMVMQAGSAVVGAAVAGQFASANPMQDFRRSAPPGGPAGAQTFELDPAGMPSGLCVSVPKATRQTRVILRRCNDSHWQQFFPAASDTSAGFQVLISAASGQLVLTDPAAGTAGTQLQARRDRDGANQDWAFSDITTAALTAWTAPHGAHRTLAQRAAATRALMAKKGVDQTFIYNQSGTHQCVGHLFFGSGEKVVQKLQPGCDIMDEHFVSDDINGFPEYRFTFNAAGGSDYMASTNTCDKVTQKTSASSNGTVWIIYSAPNDNLYLIPRFCVGMDEYDVQMGGNNTNGAQWQVGSNLSLYRAMIFSLNDPY